MCSALSRRLNLWMCSWIYRCVSVYDLLVPRWAPHHGRPRLLNKRDESNAEKTRGSSDLQRAGESLEKYFPRIRESCPQMTNFLFTFNSIISTLLLFNLSLQNESFVPVNDWNVASNHSINSRKHSCIPPFSLRALIRQWDMWIFMFGWCYLCRVIWWRTFCPPQERLKRTHGITFINSRTQMIVNKLRTLSANKLVDS